MKPFECTVKLKGNNYILVIYNENEVYERIVCKDRDEVEKHKQEFKKQMGFMFGNILEI